MNFLGGGGMVALLLLKAMLLEQMQRQFEEQYPVSVQSLNELNRNRLEGMPHVTEAIYEGFMSLKGRDTQKLLVQKYRGKINECDDTIVDRLASVGPTNDPKRAPFFNFSFNPHTLDEKKASVVHAASLVVKKRNLMPFILL